MSSSLKIGAVSGLVAGFVSGIIFSIFARVALYVGLWEPYGRNIWPYSIEVSMLLGAIFGVVLGVIYSKAYSVIPGKGIQKGAYFGLIIYLIHTVRMETFTVAYAYLLDAAAELLSFFFMWVAYGLVLAVLYEFLLGKYLVPKERLKIAEYGMRSGILPGAIAGLCGGIAAATAAVLGPALGLVMFGVPAEPTVDFLISQFGTHVFINMVWGTIFGMIFPKVYNLVPGKGAIKGLIFGLTVFLITTFQYCIWFGSMAVFHNAYELAFFNIVVTNFVGFFQFLFFGLVLGALYKK